MEHESLGRRSRFRHRDELAVVLTTTRLAAFGLGRRAAPATSAPMMVRIRPGASSVATAGCYQDPSRDRSASAKALVNVVETMGLEPTTPCLQTMGCTVQERPEPS
jgi:hypothetical protein